MHARALAAPTLSEFCNLLQGGFSSSSPREIEDGVNENTAADLDIKSFRRQTSDVYSSYVVVISLAFSKREFERSEQKRDMRAYGENQKEMAPNPYGYAAAN